METRWMKRLNENGEEEKFYPITHSKAIVCDDGTVTLDDKIIGYLPLTSGTLTDTLYIERATYPGVIFTQTTNSEDVCLRAYDHAAVLEIKDVSDDSNNRRMIALRGHNNSTSNIENSVYLRDYIDGSYTSYSLYGTHNITKGTTSLTAGSSALTTNCIYLQYE